MDKKKYQEQDLKKSHNYCSTVGDIIKSAQSQFVLNFYSESAKSSTTVSLSNSSLLQVESKIDRLELFNNQCCN